MRNTMTYAEWYQTVEKPRLAKITHAERVANDNTHDYATLDEVVRCKNCEVGYWNGWKAACHA